MIEFYLRQELQIAETLLGIKVNNHIKNSDLKKSKGIDEHYYYGIFINEQDDWGNTPLHYAALSGSVECAKILIEY